MPESRAQSSPVTVCTLWEADSYKGVGTLVNSLVLAGYRGRIWAGYRGKLPDWGPLSEFAGGQTILPVIDGVEVVFIKLDTSAPLTQYQPTFVLKVLSELDNDAEGVYYFDPAIFTLARWDFFEKWLKFGLAVCEDCKYQIHPNHPMVRAWQDSLSPVDNANWRPPRAYLSNCLVGVQREWISFIRIWQELMNANGENHGLQQKYEPGHNADWDALTIATGLSPVPISWVGNDGLGLGRGEWLTLYARSKPWKRRVIFELLTKGRRPDLADRLYWSMAAVPIPVENADHIVNQQRALRVAAALGRFYSGR
jgi:hypothetical protein